MADSGRRPWAPLTGALTIPVRELGRLVGVSDHADEVVVPTTKQPTQVTWSVYEEGVRRAGGDDLQQGLAHELRAGFVWFDLQHPTEAEFDFVAKRFALHPLATEDAIHAHQRPKLETFEDSLFLVLKTASYVDDVEVIEIGEILCFLGENYIITVRHGVSSIAHLREELEARSEIMSIGPSGVLWAVADRVVDDYARATVGLSDDVEQVESDVFSAERSAPTQRIYKLQREVIDYRRAVEPLSAALAPIVEGRVSLIDEQTVAYFRDVQDHALREAGRLNSFYEALGGILQAHIAIVTLNQSQDVRKITSWAAILAMLTTVAGVYGMNFENMPELKWKYGYFYVLGLMVTISVVMVALFRRRRWL